MTPQQLRTLSLAIALCGACTILLQLSADLYQQYGGSPLPRFHKSVPHVPDWPGHLYLPVG